MKKRSWKLEDGRWSARSVLECGGCPSSVADLRRVDSTAEGGLRRVERGTGLTPLLTHATAADAKAACALTPHPPQSKTWRNIIASLALLGVALSASAQGYSIDWSTIDGGGGTSTGGVYSVTGTIGQPDAGKMSGGNFTLSGGFWGVIAAVQTPGAPYLWVTLTLTNTVVVYWAVPEANWQLEATTNLITAGSVWTPRSYETNGANCIYIESPPSGNRFYRLKNP
jgi:hypothetical protein